MRSTTDSDDSCPLALALAGSLRANREALTRRWLDRIAARVSIDRNRIFPTDALLDHVPLLIDGIADYVADPAREITAEMSVVAKARELGALRHGQGFDSYEILKEYELLGGVLFSHFIAESEQFEEPCSRAELLGAAQRLFRAVTIIQQTTITHYLELAQGQVKEREERLRAFHRALSHEFKNRIGAVLGAGDLLVTIPDLPEQERTRFAKIVVRNAREMQHTLANLLDLSRLEAGRRQQRHVELPEVTAEVLRRLREAAEAGGVEVAVEGDLPPLEVNAAAVELALTNYVSNAIKYADPAKPRRIVAVRADLCDEDGDGCQLEIRVADNGRGVPESARPQLFQRFFRAHESTANHIEGTGLGLSIVRETVEGLGGRVWAEFPENGSVFGFAMPCRRADDTASA